LLNTAWDFGYFEEPRAATLDEIAAELDITRQSLSQRLRRGHHALIANTIRVTPIAEEKA
jgi:predicted DNA binding protein